MMTANDLPTEPPTEPPNDASIDAPSDSPSTWRNEEPELWLFRHGATAWAKDGRHTGRTDLPLLPEGEDEARALAPMLANLQFEQGWVSPLQRARRTCELAGLGDRAQVQPLLQEWDYGDVEGLTTAELRQRQPGWSVWRDGCTNGEDAAAVDQRCANLLALILQGLPELRPSPPSQPPAPRRLALFSHGQFLRAVAAHWIGLGAASGRLLCLHTATLSVLGHEREQRAIVRWNAPSAWTSV